MEPKQLKALAELYADPNTKVMSLWTMGVNQHTRGVWVNNMLYNVHLLTGKISEAGNSPFSLTGQPSACGTAREVGTFAHRLPADMVVTNPEHRKIAEKYWKLPAGTVPDWVGSHAVKQNRDLKRNMKVDRRFFDRSKNKTQVAFNRGKPFRFQSRLSCLDQRPQPFPIHFHLCDHHTENT